MWNVYNVDENTRQLAHSAGRSFFQEIQITRLWNARHGAVYAPITPDTQPNPYLDVPDRDITTTTGHTLTKINPAFMTRQIAEIAREKTNIHYHLTSLNPIRPENKADAWETTTLLAFEKGEQERLNFIKSETVYRYMAPLYVEEACLACHAKQGYQLGDIRGGISVTIPGTTYMTTADASKYALSVVHLAFWGGGLCTLYLFRRFRDRHIVLLDQKNQKLNQEIQERKTIEQALHEAKLAAESANMVKSEFLANISHEIRTPMHAILGFTEILQEKAESTRQQHYLTSIRSSAKALLSLFSDILELSKIEANILKLQKEPVYIKQTLEEIRDLFLPEIESKELQFTIKISPSLPTSVLLDRIHLKQILINLIGNAIKFTQRGEIKVTVSSERHREESNIIALVFDIQDTGVGISHEQREMIFEVFRQKDGSKCRKHGGLGIGLTMAKRLIDMMQGEIKIESQPGNGSRFRILFPHVQVIEEAVLDTSPPQISETSEQSDIKQETSFLLSDEAKTLLPGLIERIDATLLPQWQEIHESFVMQEVVAFALTIQEIAQTHHIARLVEYSHTLYASAQRYDVSAVEKSLAAFPNLTEQLKAYKESGKTL